MQAEAGEADIDRKSLLEFRVAIVEQAGRKGNRRGDAVADRVHHHRALVDEAGMEQLQPIGAGGDRRLVGLEADVAIGVEIELGEGFGQLGRGPVIGGCGEIAARAAPRRRSRNGPSAAGRPPAPAPSRRRSGQDAGAASAASAGQGEGVDDKAAIELRHGVGPRSGPSGGQARPSKSAVFGGRDTKELAAICGLRKASRQRDGARRGANGAAPAGQKILKISFFSLALKAWSSYLSSLPKSHVPVVVCRLAGLRTRGRRNA